MFRPIPPQIFSEKDLTNNVLIATGSVGNIPDPILLHVVLLLGRTGGMLYARGSTYTIRPEITRIVDGNPEILRMQPIPVISVSYNPDQLPPPEGNQFDDSWSETLDFWIPVEPNDTINLYAKSCNVNDTAVNGAVWFYDNRQAVTHVL